MATVETEARGKVTQQSCLVAEALAGLAEAVVVVDSQGHVVAAVGGLASCPALTAVPALGEPLRNVVVPTAWAALEQLVTAGLASTPSVADVACPGERVVEVCAVPVAAAAAVRLNLRDATRARAEERARELTAREFRALAETSTDGLCRYDPDGVLLWASPSMQTLTGRSSASLTGLPVEAVIHPDDLPRRNAAFEELLRTGRPHTIVLRAEHADGTWHWFECTVRGWFDESGQLLEAHVAVRDVSDEHADAEIRRQWQLSFDLTRRGIALIDPGTSRIVQVNQAFASMHGGRIDDFADMPISETLAEEWRPRAPEFARTAAEEGYAHCECDRVRLDGSVFPADVEIIAGRDPSGTLLYRLVYVSDLTALRAREASEILAVQRFERAYEEATMGMVLVRGGRIERVNSAAAAMVGRAARDLVGCEPRVYVHPDDTPRIAEAEAALRAGSAPPRQELRIARPDGQVLHTRHTYSVLQDRDAHGDALALVHITDRTAEVLAERERAGALRLFSTAVDQAPIGMCLVALDGRFLRVNRKLCELFERSEGDLLATTFQELTHPDDLESDLSFLRACIEGKRDTYEQPKRYLTASGRTMEAFLSVGLIRSSSGQPQHFVFQIVDLTEAHAAERQLRLLEERDRIAHGLHDTTVQRLFAIGLRLQAIAITCDAAPVAERLTEAVDALDVTIRGIRSTIYGMRAPGTGAGTRLRDRLTAVVEEVIPRLGHRPQLTLSGALEVAVSDELSDEIVGFVREVLSGNARSGEPTCTEVTLALDATHHQMELQITDDGRVEEYSPGFVRRLQLRAEDHGGTCRLDTPVRNSHGRPAPGRRVTWRVSIS